MKKAVFEERVPEHFKGKKEKKKDLGEIARLFLRLGTTAFGGPAAHIAMMEDEVVRKRQWISREEFLDLLSATALIPGPNSTEMAIHIGHRRGGWAGLLVAGASFILPSVFIVGLVSWGYVRYGRIPAAEGILYGIRPVILAVVLQAILRLAPSALKSGFLALAGAASMFLSLYGVNEIALLLGCGLAAVLADRETRRTGGGALSAFLFFGGFAAVGKTAAEAALAVPFSLERLFLFFAKVGSVLFGSGYVLLAFLRADLVEKWHWLTESQLLDAVAVGQITPGPVFTTATFIGYLLGGIPGAAAGTLGIFLPAFVFVALSGPLVPRMRRSPLAGSFLDGVNAASLALMVAVSLRMARGAIFDIPTMILAGAGGLLLLKYRINTTWLLAGAALAGMLLRALPFR